MIYIRNKLLRIVAGCLLLGGMASIFAYSIMIISSGDIVGKVQPVEVASYENRIRSYDSMFRKAEFQKIYFPEMLLAPEMGKLKLELIVMGTGGSSRRYKLLTPVFSLADSASNEIVFQEKIETEMGSYYYYSSPFEESRRHYLIGSVTVPRTGTYTLTADLGTYFSFDSGITLQIKKDALDFDMQFIIIMAVCMVLGAVLAYLTSSPDQRKSRKWRN